MQLVTDSRKDGPESADGSHGGLAYRHLQHCMYYHTHNGSISSGLGKQRKM